MEVAKRLLAEEAARQVTGTLHLDGTEVTVIVAGDLNSKYKPGLYEAKLKREGFRNCFDHRIRTHRLIGTLDWIAVRGPGVCEDARALRGMKGSDHDPLTAKIIVRGASRRSATRGGL